MNNKLFNGGIVDAINKPINGLQKDQNTQSIGLTKLLV